ncbi:hypothetical protein [uncultured Mediterranean phage uvMED]|nr:hypothetical protein [uncultured Mediterranean phage uvMED]
MNPKYHYDNIGQLLAKHPLLIGVIEQHGIPEPTTNSQLEALKSPNATIDTYGNVFSLFQSKNLRWQGNQGLAEMDQDARYKRFKNNGDYYNLTLNLVWDLVDPETKIDLHAGTFVDTSSAKVIDKNLVRSYLNTNSSAWHIIDKDEDRVMHMDSTTQLANFYAQRAAYDNDKAIQKAVKSLWSFMVTGRNDSTGVHHGIPAKTNVYGVTGNQVASGAERAVVETLMKYKKSQFDLLGSERLTPQMKTFFLDEAFKNRGSIQVDVALAEDGQRWKLVLRELEEQEDWFDLPNDYLPLKVTGDLLIDGKPVYFDWNEVHRMSLSAEIVSGLHQIEEVAGPRLPGGSTIWEDLIEHEEEYIGTENNAPTIRPDTLSGQQFPKTDFMKGFLLGAPQNFSKAQVDFVLKPMINHFKGNFGKGPEKRYITEPTDGEIRDYINKELAKHGDRTTKIKEYFSINQHTFSFLFEAPMTPEQTIETDENLIPFL